MFEILDCNMNETVCCDEDDPDCRKRVGLFLDAYLELCRLHGCVVACDGHRVEVIADDVEADKEDPWDIKWATNRRGWFDG